jgi:hypothetical protein
MDEERCPGCRGLIIDGVCPYCTSPIPGLQPLEPEAPEAAAAERGSPRVRGAMNLLVFALGAYWVAAAGRQFQLALDNRPGGGPLLLFGVALLSLIIGSYTGHVAWMMFRRSYRAQGQLMLVAVAGIAWGIFVLLLLEDWCQLPVVLLHAIAGVFAAAGSRYFELDRS